MEGDNATKTQGTTGNKREWKEFRMNQQPKKRNNYILVQKPEDGSEQLERQMYLLVFEGNK